MILVTVMVFSLMRLVPGDPAIAYLAGDDGEGFYTQEELANLRAKLGTDRSLVVQYGDWMWDMLRLDFGVSTFYQTPISEDLKQKIPITVELAVLAVFMAAVVAIPLGILSAVKQDTPIDYIARVISIGGVAMPTFWVGLLVIYFLVELFNYLPILGYVNLWDDPLKNLEQLYLPAIALGFNNMSIVARVTRSSMLEVFREDYIRTARSKGLRDFIVIGRHALKNSLLPVVTITGLEFQQPDVGDDNNRENLCRARHGESDDSCYIQPRLHHGTVHDHGDNLFRPRNKSHGRYDLRLAGSPHTLRLVPQCPEREST